MSSQISATIVNFGAACSLFFFIGSIYATGVFNDAINSVLPADSQLREVFAKSFSLTTLSCGPIMIGASFYLGAGGSDCAVIKTRRVQFLGAIGASFFLSFALASAGLRRESGWLIVVGVTLLAIPFGIFYYLCTELLTVWLPNNSGFAIGSGQFFFGLGTITFTSVFSTLVRLFDAHTAILYSGLLLTMLSLIPAIFLSWPTNTVDSEIDVEFMKEEVDCRSDVGEEVELGGVLHVPLRHLLRDTTFWQYQLIVFCSQTGFALIPFFFQFGGMYGASQATIATLFQACNAVGTAARLGGGMISDLLGRGSSGGARKLLIFLLALQTIGFLTLSFAGEDNFGVFMVTTLFLFAAIAGGTCTCAILARDLFGTTNSGAVFACGGGVATGLGESCATQIVAFTIAKMRHSRTGPAIFAPAFFVLASFALVGLLSIILVRRSRMTFPHLSDPNKGEVEAKYGSTLNCERGLDLRKTHIEEGKNSPGNKVTRVLGARTFAESSTSSSPS